MARRPAGRRAARNRAQQPRTGPPRARADQTLHPPAAQAAKRRGRAAGQSRRPSGKNGVCMDIKDAVAEYRPEITPQTREDSVPPGYKRTEVGVIPEDWAVVQLEENFDIASSKRVLQSQWQTTGVPFYRTREIAEIGRDTSELQSRGQLVCRRLL